MEGAVLRFRCGVRRRHFYFLLCRFRGLDDRLASTRRGRSWRKTFHGARLASAVPRARESARTAELGLSFSAAPLPHGLEQGDDGRHCDIQ